MYEVDITNTLGLIWRPWSLSELTTMIINMGLTYLGSEASIYTSDNASNFVIDILVMNLTNSFLFFFQMIRYDNPI